MLKDLSAALDEMIHVQKQLSGFADEKQTVLIERRVDDLNELVKKEAQLIKQMNTIETERERITEVLLAEHGASGFNDMVAGIPDELMKRKLQIQVSTLQDLLIELQSKNKINERLLLDSMQFVQHMIDQVTKTKQQQFNYQSPIGQPKPQTNSQGFFDTKA